MENTVIKSRRKKIPDSKFTALAIFLIILLGFSIYSNTFDASFHFDDHKNIVNNTAIQDLANLKQIWDHHKTRFLTYLTFALNYHFGKLEVFGYHAVNITIHILSSTTLYFLFLLILATPRMQNHDFCVHGRLIGLFASLIFLTHPIQTQGVTYIVQRATSLTTLFYICSVYLYIKARLTRRFCYHIFALLTTICAMLSKPVAFTLPLMLVVCECVFFGISKDNVREKLKYILPYLATLIIIPLLVTMSPLEVKEFGGIRDITRQTQDISRVQYLLTQCNVIRTYIRLLFLPINQSFDYVYPLSYSFADIKTLFSSLFLLSTIIWALMNYKKRMLFSFGILWFFLSLSVESSFYPLDDVIFEHRLYLPMAGFSVFFTAIIFTLLKDKKKCIILASIIIITCCILTYQRNKAWNSEITLWQDVIKKFPNNDRAYYSVALAYDRAGDYDRAIDYYLKVLHINPWYTNAPNNLGVIYAKQGNHAKAVKYYQKALKLEPNNAKYCFNIARSYEYTGAYGKAISYYKKAIRLDKNDRETFNNLGAIYLALGQFKEAILYAHKAIELKNDFAEAHAVLGNSYFFQEKFSKARVHLEKAIVLFRAEGALEKEERAQNILQRILMIEVEEKTQ